MITDDNWRKSSENDAHSDTPAPYYADFAFFGEFYWCLKRSRENDNIITESFFKYWLLNRIDNVVKQEADEADGEADHPHHEPEDS